MIRITSRNIHSTFTPKSKVLYALNYKYVPDVLNRRNEPWNPQEKGGMLIRDAHIEFLEPFQKAGSVMLGGAFNPPDAGALMVLNMASEEEVNNFAKNDPYVLSGVVEEWEVKPWTVMVNSLSKE